MQLLELLVGQIVQVKLEACFTDFTALDLVALNYFDEAVHLGRVKSIDEVDQGEFVFVVRFRLVCEVVEVKLVDL